jgi:hypothetical protein
MIELIIVRCAIESDFLSKGLYIALLCLSPFGTLSSRELYCLVKNFNLF